MNFIIILLIFVALLIILFLAYSLYPYRYPFLTESDWTTHRSPWWQLYYSSKWLSPVKRAARGSGLETVFGRDMGLDTQRGPLLNQTNVVIKAAGDLMCRKDMTGGRASELWDHIGGYLFDADLTIGNLEFAVNPKRVVEKLVRFSVPPDRADPLIGDPRYGKFQVLSLANNHINDSFSGGIVSTCDYVDSRGIIRTGANRNPHEQDDFPIVERKGVRIAVLAYTFSNNGIPLEADFAFGTNLVRFNALDDKNYNPSLIFKHIAQARSRGADFIICCNHWGVEFEYFPPLRIVKRAHEILEAGADLIIGHHPHIVNPMERYRTSDGRSTAVLYSLGNLTSWALPLPVQKMSELAEIVLETGFNKEGKKSVRIGEITLTPVIHLMNGRSQTRTHRLLPLSSRSGLSARDRRFIKKASQEYLRHFRQKGVLYR